jgi:hypothetical protein
MTTTELAMLFQELTGVPFKLMYEDCRGYHKELKRLMHLKFMWVGLCRFFKRSFPQIGRSIKRDGGSAHLYYRKHKDMLKNDPEYKELYGLLMSDVRNRLYPDWDKLSLVKTKS